MVVKAYEYSTGAFTEVAGWRPEGRVVRGDMRPPLPLPEWCPACARLRARGLMNRGPFDDEAGPASPAAAGAGLPCPSDVYLAASTANGERMDMDFCIMRSISMQGQQ